jgi:hypothetical protein
VVHSTGRLGERDHRVRSILYEKRRDADVELARLRAQDPESALDIWHATTYIEPAAWPYDVALANGVLLHPGGRTESRLSAVGTRATW